MSSINAPIVEYFPFWPVEIGNELFWYIFEGEPQAKDGYIELDDTKPGLGIELSEKYLKDFVIEGEEFEKYCDKWSDRLADYYSKNS